MFEKNEIDESIEKGGPGSGQKGHKGVRPDVSQSPVVKAMKEHGEKVKALKGEKQRMGNPVTRSLYEEKSLKANKWLSVKEFEESIKKTPAIDALIQKSKTLAIDALILTDSKR